MKISKYLALPLIIVAAFFITILIALVVFQQFLVFFPPQTFVDDRPKSAEELLISTTDGVQLSSWYFPAAAPGAITILYFHGNAENISHKQGLTQWTSQHGFGLLLFDYRGYGMSGGKIPANEHEFFLDADAAWNQLVQNKKIPAEKIVLWGRSLGGAAAMQLASSKQPGGVILQSTLASGLTLAHKQFPWLPVSILSRFPLRNDLKISKLTAPVLIIHAPDDSEIPFAHGERLFTLASQPKQFVTFSGGHNISYPAFFSQVGPEILEFLESLK